MKHNNVLPNGHFHKHWQQRIKTWFDQPGRKQSRRIARMKKAKAIAPRPVDGLLRPAVHCQTIRYNSKVRKGRGFTLDELKAAGIRKKEALSIGIAVDYRRTNRSEESLKLNVQRLLDYKARLVIFPRNKKAVKRGDASAEELKNVVQLVAPLMPIKNIEVHEAPRAITADEMNLNAYETQRRLRSNQKHAGMRKKRAMEKAIAEAEKKA